MLYSSSTNSVHYVNLPVYYSSRLGFTTHGKDHQ